MATITPQMVKELRVKTDAGMMDCKKALVECDGNMDEAVKYLREKGIAKAAKKADREAKEGVVATVVEGKDGVIFEINCETDFCSKGDKFRALVAEVGAALKASAATTLDEALNVPMAGTTVEKYIAEQCAAIGENMKFRKFGRYTLAGEGSIVSYIHMGGKVGVLLQVSCTKPETAAAEDFVTMCKDITLHIAACAPKSVDSSSLDPAFIAEEQEIAKAQLIAEGKPEKLLEKILPGKLKALYKQSCLLSQEFVKDPSISVEKLVADTGKKLGDTLKVEAFLRYQLGA
ncbi:MAG: translation elongation factor Ts [Akkermansia muciniphila]|nr:translation elongation factor Ts [Akkermansia muciniphila]MCI7004015.1 translation elongation factor Ts [Akkermansia muciniphila]MDD6814645.1 translation elongation factor Ts [Akkermansia muciniphila]